MKNIMITILNVIFGVAILTVPLFIFGAAFGGSEYLMTVIVLYPFVAIISIVMSRMHHSIIWALSPLIFFFLILPILSAFIPWIDRLGGKILFILLGKN